MVTANGRRTQKELFESIKFYDVRGRGAQAFSYDSEITDKVSEFYDDAMQFDSEFTTRTQLGAHAEKLWQYSRLYNARAGIQRVQSQATGIKQAMKRVIEELEMDTVDNIRDADKEFVLHWHSILCGTEEGSTINDETIPQNNATQGKAKRAKMIFEDLQEKFGL